MDDIISRFCQLFLSRFSTSVCLHDVAIDLFGNIFPFLPPNSQESFLIRFTKYIKSIPSKNMEIKIFCLSNALYAILGLFKNCLHVSKPSIVKLKNQRLLNHFKEIINVI